MALMRRRVYSGIRVSDIAKKAGIGRATFYAHYQSKHELLRVQFRRVVFLLIKDQPQMTWLFDCAPLFAHIKEAQFAFRSLMTGSSRLVTERIMRDCLEQRVLTTLANNETSVAHSAAPRFVAASLMTLIIWWVENGLQSTPAEMQAAYRAFVGGGLQAVKTSIS